MRTTSQTWKDIVANGEFDMESVARIYGATGNDTNGVAGSDSRGSYKEYGTITAPVITRSLLSGDALSVGNAIAGQLKFTIMTTDTIPKSAMIVIRARVKKDSSVSEWLEFGTFWLDHRTVTDNLTDVEAYDAMKKGNQAYADNSQALVWPKTIKVVVQRIAEQMGVAIDSRTTTDVINADVGDLDIVTKPTDDMSLLDILGNIGGILGGNWIITDENKLRFVALVSPENRGNLLDHEDNIIATNDGDKLLWNGLKGRDDENPEYIITDCVAFNGVDYGGPIYYKKLTFYPYSLFQTTTVYLCDSVIAGYDNNGNSAYLAIEFNNGIIVADKITLNVMRFYNRFYNNGSVIVVASNDENKDYYNNNTNFGFITFDKFGNQKDINFISRNCEVGSINGKRYNSLFTFTTSSHGLSVETIVSFCKTSSISDDGEADYFFNGGQLAYIVNNYNSSIISDNNNDALNVPVVVNSIDTASKYIVSKITMLLNKDTVYTVGNNSGYEITVPNNPYASQAMADLLFSRINGIVYIPFEATGCVYDIAGELGDNVAIGADISSILYKETRKFDIGFSADISAPGRDEMEDEYPFQTFVQKTTYTVEALNRDVVQNRTSIEQTQERVTIMAEQYTPKDSIRSVFAVDPTNIVLSAGVDPQGHATGKITFNSGTVAINSTNFTLTETGVITCTAGNIGGIHITSDSLYSGSKSSYNSYQSGFFLGSDGKLDIGDNTNYIRFDGSDIAIKVDNLSWSSTNSSMTADGTLTCHNANIDNTNSDGYSAKYASGRIEFSKGNVKSKIELTAFDSDHSNFTISAPHMLEIGCNDYLSTKGDRIYINTPTLIISRQNSHSSNTYYDTFTGRIDYIKSITLNSDGTIHSFERDSKIFVNGLLTTNAEL